MWVIGQENQEQANGRKEEELIMGDTRENKTEPFEGKTQTELKTIPQRCNEQGRDNPGSVVRGKPVVKNRKETHQEQERRDPWRLASDEEEHWDITN